jgi:hypothetical protein
MSVGGIGTSASETDSSVLTVRHDVTATDSNVFANRQSGNLKLGKRATLTINNGVGSKDIRDFFGPLRDSLTANANQAPQVVQAAVNDDVVNKIERLETDRAEVSAASIKKYLIWGVLFIAGLMVLGVGGAVVAKLFKGKKS